MQYEQIKFNDFNDLNQSNSVDAQRQIIGAIDMDACVQRAHSARAEATAAGILAIRKAVLRLFA